MANQRREGVSYRQFRAQPNLSEGLLSVSRDDGELERKVAGALARVADNFGQRADRQAAIAGERAGQRAAMAGAPEAASVTGGEATTASVNGQAGHIAGAQGGVRVYTGTAREQAKAIIRDEEGFRPKPYWDINAWRIGYGSDTVTLPDGRSVKVTPGMVISREDAERDLDYRLDRREGARVREQLGDGWDALPPTVQAVLGSVGYNYGSLPADVVAAARSGNIASIADTVRGLSANKDRRAREAALIAGGGPVPASATADGYKPLPASSVGPVSVTRVDRPVSIEPGKPGTFRPTNSDTIYGRAYDVAGTRTYLQELDLTMLQDQEAVYEAYKDDPVKLEKAYGELLQAHMKESVFDEIAPEYSLAFRKRAYARVQDARDAAEEKRKATDRVSFIGRVEEIENAKSQALAGLDPDSETAPAELERLQGSIDDHYDSAVARGLMTVGEAENAKRASRSDMVTGFYAKQASKKTATEIRTMRDEMTRDYAAGKLEGVNADDWQRIETGLIAAEKARETQDEKANSDLTKRGEDLAKRVARGLPVTADELARFQLDASTAPNGSTIVASTLTRMKVSEAIRTLPIGEVEKRLTTILGDKATADDIDFARRTIDAHRKDVRNDPIGVAERFGVLPVSPGLPLDGEADPEAVSSAFSERINQAQAAARHFGVAPRYFRPGEADAIEEAVKADPAKGVSIAAGLVDAAGRDARRMLLELGETAPAIAGAGEIVAAGGDPRAARDLVAGYGPGPDGKAYPDMKSTKRIPIARDIAGEALAFAPDQVNRLDEQAAAIARKRLADQGIDPKSEDARPVFERAFNEAAGATYAGNVQFGGFAGYDPGIRWKERKVLVPPSIRADRFGDVIAALEDADIGSVKAKNGKAWAAADFKRAMPVAVAGGYVFALGDPSSAAPMWIANEKGDPLVLDLANIPALKARVPEAFR